MPRPLVRALSLALLLVACKKAPCAQAPADEGLIEVTASAVPLDSGDPERLQLGAFTYAGGVELRSTGTSLLHGLSDIRVRPDGRFLALGDRGHQAEGRLRLDARGRLIGLADVRIRALKGPDGQELYGQGDALRDAEGVAELPNGDRLVSFEGKDRILLYPAGGGPPREVPSPDGPFDSNKGMEALDLYPPAGADAYLVGVESTGRTFICRLSGGCEPGRSVALPDGYQLVALASLPGGGVASLLRFYGFYRGSDEKVNRSILRITAPDGGALDELELAAPLVTENFEGLAAVPGPGGAARFYLISDDNFDPSEQRTLLLAFDWRPASGR